MYLQLLRPEFPLSPEDEADILQLGGDVAGAFESVAAESMHTASLYAVFLKALLNAKTEGDAHLNSADDHSGGGATTNSEHALNGAAEEDPVYPPLDFQYASEMGPVVDISTFPPTMAQASAEAGGMGMLSMDSILSGGFWDNVLVPGTSAPCLFPPELTIIGRRLLERA
jgi:hypothetical protein